MSRQSVPRIDPEELRDVASDERVERIWGRLEQDLSALRVRPAARAPRTMVWAAAATFAAFGVGLVAGRFVWSERQIGPSQAVATIDRASVDVFAAGTQERTFALPGGGSLTLQPGSMIELERSGGSDVRLRLIAGEASLDTAQEKQGALAIVSGEATVATSPGSVVRVEKREDNLDVRVSTGSAQVSSPAGTQALRTGERMDGVPTRVTSAAVTPQAGRVTPVHTARTAGSGTPVVQVAVAPSWRERYSANKYDEALDLLRQQPGGIAGAVASANSAEELMMISDLARLKGGDASEGIKALKRVADEHGGTAYGSIAARQLGKHYETAGQADLAKKYMAQAAQKGVFGEDALCDQMLAEQRAGNKSEASARATEYLGKYPNGRRCKDDANRILSGGDADAEGEPSKSADVPAPGAPAASPSVSATAAPAVTAPKPQ